MEDEGNSGVWLGGDDSAVVVDLAHVPSAVAEIVFVLTMRREDEESLGQLSYVGCRVYDSPLAQIPPGTLEHEHCAFEVICSQLYGSNAVYLARLERLPSSKSSKPKPSKPSKLTTRAATPTVVRRRKCVDLSTEDDASGSEVVALLRSHSSAALARSHCRREFDLSIDATPATTEEEEEEEAAEDGWRLVTAAEAIEGCTAAFAAYAVSVRAAPDVPRREMIFRLGGAAEAERSSDEKDLSENPSRAGSGTPPAPAPAQRKPLFHDSDRRACAAPDDHYAGFVEYAIMRTIVAGAGAGADAEAPRSEEVEPVPRDRRRTLVAPPRPVPARSRRRGTGSARGASPSRCVVM